MSAKDKSDRQCDPLGVYGKDEGYLDPTLLWMGLIHCYCVVVFGTLGNALVLWCVKKCKTTGQPMKVLLFGVFLSSFVMCVGILPFTAGEYRAVLLTCNEERMSESTYKSAWTVFLFLTLIKLSNIAAIALVRVVVIWAPQRPKLGAFGAVLVSGATLAYAGATGLTIGNKFETAKSLVQPLTAKSIKDTYFLAMAVPVLITAVAYLYMIYTIHQNGHHLTAHQEPEGDIAIMDPTTLAMLAVFISNLLFRIPSAVFHLTNYQPVYQSEIFQVILTTHFVVDPLAYMWFNISCRRRVKSMAREVKDAMSFFRTRLSALRTGANASCDQQSSSTDVQEESTV